MLLVIKIKHDEIQLKIFFREMFIVFISMKDLHCKPGCVALLLRTICCKIRSVTIASFDVSFASRRRKRITPVASKHKKYSPI